jgi:hypothetical protein
MLVGHKFKRYQPSVFKDNKRKRFDELHGIGCHSDMEPVVL